ncbi:ankyrin repeat domain-containing protein [Actinomadura parmotrematis]|uniref:Ankyrin repeat domain-containing protein n=1 Tax=Actinomadura parmotrematis TaxID=2864039 RepID=A0ABS7FZ19_9ACTN|nr:ankyrin repeat domain-containing protein [Actinomadura parmotrematis]MBW8485689.1 ankyrin repeat domain-containing protein [Actinomadura parmotrematis]
MTPPAAPPSNLAPDERADWLRVRRYAVPAWMIERATERRLAGDWRGACAAADVEVRVDLAALPPAAAAALEDDLAHFAPDLLRWHLPRVLEGRSTITTHNALKLREDEHGVLYVTTPVMVDGPQRLVLRHDRAMVEKAPGGRMELHHADWSGLRYRWDVRAIDGVRGGESRTPYFDAAGEPVPPPAAPPSGGVELVEWTTLLNERGDLRGALEAVGLAVPDPAGFDTSAPWGSHTAREIAPVTPIDFPLLARTGLGCVDLGGGLYLKVRDGRAVAVDWNDLDGVPHLDSSAWRRSPDLDLLRSGLLSPEELHPLVRAGMFPARGEADGPVGPRTDPVPPSPVRVRCQGGWHEVAFRDGALAVPHTAEEIRRERALGAFGGKVAGCFAVRTAVETGEGRLPKALRAQMRELYLRAQHGDTPAVLALLDAGVPPVLRDGRRRTLLHHLHMLDHERLLPRLLDAGLDIDVEDGNGRTPLHMAVGDYGSEELVRALVERGARIDTVDNDDVSLAYLIRQHKRTELEWLRDRVEKEHPGVGYEYEYWGDDEDGEDEDGEDA